MSKIDVFLKTIIKLGATGLTLQSGENIVLHFPSGDRHAAQKTEHEALADLVNFVAPAEAQTALYMDQPASFDLDWEAHRFAITAIPAGSRLTVNVERCVDAAPAPTPEPASAPEPAPGMPQLTAEDEDIAGLVVGNTLDPGPRAPEPAPARSPVPAQPEPRPAPTAAAAPRPTAQSQGLVESLLRQMSGLGASDLHLSTNSHPYLRLHGEMKPLTDRDVLDADALFAELQAIMPEKNRAEFENLLKHEGIELDLTGP